jgi:hypothetical protein
LSRVNDDWRLQIEAGEAGEAMVEKLNSRELEHDLDEAFGDTVIVSRDGEVLFLYAGTREQAEAALALVQKLARENDWALAAELTRWHPDAQEWEGPDVPLPQNETERKAEHEEAIADERVAVGEDGEPVFEVRVELDSHRDAVRFAEQLEGEGLRVVRRWKYLVVGAGDEDAAQQLASRLREGAPVGSEVTVEGSGAVAWAERPANPFAIFGGLGV